MLNGRIAIVTGASAGIGLAIAHELLKNGARVVINARRADRLQAIAKDMNAQYGRSQTVAVAVDGDASKDATVTAMLDEAARAFGSEADLVVVNAGRGLAGSVLTSDTAQWEEMVRTNVLGAASLMRQSAQRMVSALEKKGGSGSAWKSHAHDVVVIGSVVGRHVSPFSSMYGGTKFAVHGMTEGLRREVAAKGVRVTLIEPGFVVSEFQGVAGYKAEWFEGVVDRIGPVLQPEDVARSVTYICSQPPHVHVSDILIRPTRQDYP